MARKQARRGNRSSGLFPAFAAGVVFGLGLAMLAWVGGYLPHGDQTPPGLPSGRDEPALIESPGDASDAGNRDSRYDFFTVLPEIEVVVPNREIEQLARDNPEQPATSTGGSYVIQAGSFRSAADAEALKARLAMLGQIASIETVKVNDQTWHRVRLGPFENAGSADNARRELLDNGFEAMVLSDG
ncbi:MAG: SPOR domain-containing protein [Wenzhouxiangellaceae bacterium]|nr:SPOR domain-containing protein [Wenzhouxiangellaceae bacterium]